MSYMYLFSIPDENKKDIHFDHDFLSLKFLHSDMDFFKISKF